MEFIAILFVLFCFYLLFVWLIFKVLDSYEESWPDSFISLIFCSQNMLFNFVFLCFFFLSVCVMCICFCSRFCFVCLLLFCFVLPPVWSLRTEWERRHKVGWGSPSQSITFSFRLLLYRAGFTGQRKYCLPSLPSLLGPRATSTSLEGDSITAESHYLIVGCHKSGLFAKQR